MNLFDRLRFLGRRSGHARVSRPRIGFTREACLAAITQRLCVELPMLIGIVPDELIRASRCPRDEARHD